MADAYAVMGHPISHSKSPAIHTRFARESGQDLVYRAIHVMPGEFELAVARFRDQGGKGLSVTLPFKEAAWRLAAERTARAHRARAVNTLWFDAAGVLNGDNTDGIGLVRDLMANHRVDLRGRRILLLGAGGASRGVLGPLLEQAPEGLTVANRTAPRAEELVREFEGAGPLTGCGLNALAGSSFDLVINATSASLTGSVPALPPGVLAAGGWCYDMMYADEPTVFVRWGWERGASGSVDGLGMLVEQAAESFFIWRGVRPDTAAVIADLRLKAL
jgi:shikimate dehydrogenase